MPTSKQPEARQSFHVLDEAEIADPHLAIDEFFDFSHLDDARNLLWEWMKATISGQFASLEPEEKEAIIVLYEKTEKLMEAAYALHTGKKPPSAKK